MQEDQNNPQQLEELQEALKTRRDTWEETDYYQVVASNPLYRKLGLYLIGVGFSTDSIIKLCRSVSLVVKLAIVATAAAMGIAL